MRAVQSNNTSVSKRKITGQGLTEYIVIVALIAIAAVAAVGFFGSAVKTQFVSLGTELVGGQGDVSEPATVAVEASDLGSYVD